MSLADIPFASLMSAFGGKADMAYCSAHVCFDPKADILGHAELRLDATKSELRSWFIGHSLALRQLSEVARRQEGRKARRRPRTDLPVPERNQIYADMAALFRQDLANVEAGFYPLPSIMTGLLLRCFIGRGFSSRTFPPSMNGASAGLRRKS
jgi:hypothetical protein